MRPRGGPGQRARALYAHVAAVAGDFGAGQLAAAGPRQQAGGLSAPRRQPCRPAVRAKRLEDAFGRRLVGAEAGRGQVFRDDQVRKVGREGKAERIAVVDREPARRGDRDALPCDPVLELGPALRDHHPTRAAGLHHHGQHVFALRHVDGEDVVRDGERVCRVALLERIVDRLTVQVPRHPPVGPRAHVQATVGRAVDAGEGIRDLAHRRVVPHGPRAGIRAGLLTGTERIKAVSAVKIREIENAVHGVERFGEEGLVLHCPLTWHVPECVLRQRIRAAGEGAEHLPRARPFDLYRRRRFVGPFLLMPGGHVIEPLAQRPHLGGVGIDGDDVQPRLPVELLDEAARPGAQDQAIALAHVRALQYPRGPSGPSVPSGRRLRFAQRMDLRVAVAPAEAEHLPLPRDDE